MTRKYDDGDKVTIWGEFTDPDTGEAVDPDVVTFKVKDPSDNIATYLYGGGAVTKEATGLYKLEITVDESGTWYYHVSGTGGYQNAEERSLEVRTSEF